MVRQLDLNKLKEKKSIFRSTKESLQDVTPIAWSNEVLSGKAKVIVTKAKK